MSSENLFLKPKNHPNDMQRYQCVLAYPEDDPYPEHTGNHGHPLKRGDALLCPFSSTTDANGGRVF
jgi:hypothetical protein